MHWNSGFLPLFAVVILAFIILIRLAGAFFGATTERKMGRPWPAELEGKGFTGGMLLTDCPPEQATGENPTLMFSSLAVGPSTNKVL